MDHVAQEILEDRKNLEQIIGYPVRGLSYPNGSFNSRIKELLPHLGIEYARTVREHNGFALPEDLLAWDATCHHKHHLMDFAREFAGLSKKQYLYMMYVWGHSYEFDKDNNWEIIEEFCEFISGRDDIWYATNIEIVDYLKAVDNLKFTANGDLVYNPAALSVWLSVNDKITQIPGGTSIQLG